MSAIVDTSQNAAYQAYLNYKNTQQKPTSSSSYTYSTYSNPTYYGVEVKEPPQQTAREILAQRDQQLQQEQQQNQVIQNQEKENQKEQQQQTEQAKQLQTTKPIEISENSLAKTNELRKETNQPPLQNVTPVIEEFYPKGPAVEVSQNTLEKSDLLRKETGQPPLEAVVPVKELIPVKPEAEPLIGTGLDFKTPSIFENIGEKTFGVFGKEAGVIGATFTGTLGNIAVGLAAQTLSLPERYEKLISDIKTGNYAKEKTPGSEPLKTIPRLVSAIQRQDVPYLVASYIKGSNELVTPKVNEATKEYYSTTPSQSGIEGLAAGKGLAGFTTGRGSLADIASLSTDIFFVISGAKGLVESAKGLTKSTTTVSNPEKNGFGISIEPSIKTGKPTTEYKTVMLRPTNPYRTPLPKDIFEHDIAEPSKVSEAQPIPKNSLLEDVSKERINSFSKIQNDLIQPSNKIETKVTEPTPPEISNPLGYRGSPPVKTISTNGNSSIDQLQLARSKVVEQTRPLLNNEVFNVKGERLGVTFGETKPFDILKLPEAKPQTEPTPPEFLNVLGRKGNPPVKTIPTITKPSIDLLQIARSKVVEETKPKSINEVFNVKGEKLNLTFGETSQKNILEFSGLKESATPEDIFYSNKKDILSNRSRFNKIDPEQVLGHGETRVSEQGSPIKILTPSENIPSRAYFIEVSKNLYDVKGLGALTKAKAELGLVKEEKGYKPNLESFRTQPNKINTEAVLEIETPEIFSNKEFNVKENPELIPRKEFTAKTSIGTPSKEFEASSKDFEKIINPEKEGFAIDFLPGIFYGTKISFGKGIGFLMNNKGEAGKMGFDINKPTNPTDALGPKAKPAAKAERETRSSSGLSLIQQMEKPSLSETPIMLGEAKLEIINGKTVAKLTSKGSNKIKGITITETQPPEFVKKSKNKSETITEQIQKPQEKEIYDTILNTKSELKISQIQEPKLGQKEKQKEVFAFEIPASEMPNIKQLTGSSFKEESKQITKEVNVPKDKDRLTLLLPNDKKEYENKVKKIKGETKDYIGASSENTIVGLYNRNDITYGDKTIRKLLRKDQQKTNKSFKNTHKAIIGKRNKPKL